jgi:quercetin dioxygenase-like cupin family protein
VIQQGQVFKLKAKSADGEPLWAYRYRFAGRGSARRQVGGFSTKAEAQRSSVDALWWKGDAAWTRFSPRRTIAAQSGAQRRLPLRPRTREGGEMKSKWVWVLLVGVLGAAVYVAVALATPPSGLTNVPLARGTDVSDGTIPLQVGTDVAMAQITVVPGGSSGWHSHPGGAIVIVKQGAATVHQAIGSQCKTTTYSAGQAFIERPGEVDQVVNTGTVSYVFYVTFPRVPQGDSARIDQPDPGTCPGL